MSVVEVVAMSLVNVDYRRISSSYLCMVLMVIMMIMSIPVPVLLTEAAEVRGGDLDPYLTLPEFADDYSELVMAAVIERNFHNDDLYLVMMMMGHKAFHDMPQRPFLMMMMTNASTYSSSNNRKSFTDKWMKAAKKWDPERKVDLKDSKMHCHFRESNLANSRSYSSKAHWLPSYLSADNGFNRNLDVLRCKIKTSADLNQMLNRYNDKRYISRRKLFVTLKRRFGGDNGGANTSEASEASPSGLDNGLEKVISFTIPWRTRRAGYGFYMDPRNSRWDPWTSHASSPYINDNRNSNSNSDSNSDSDSKTKKIVAYACISTVRPLEPFRMDTGLTMLLENIEHNILIGFDHIFVGIYLSDESIHMQRYRLALDSYIKQGKVSIVSMARHLNGGKGTAAEVTFDDVSGLFGMQLNDDYSKWYNQMQCLYLAKGVADYVVLTHSSEFIVLQPEYASIQEVMSYASLHLHPASPPPSPPPHLSNNDNDINNKGLTLRVDMNQPCYFVLQTLGVPDPVDKTNSYGPGDNFWSKDFFPESKSAPVGPLPAWAILAVPTRSVWIVAWHVVAACSSLNQGPDIDWSFWADNSMGSAPAHETRAGVLPWRDLAVVYFYRGHFEPWQMNKPRHEDNQHIRRYAGIGLGRLADRGFRLKNGMLYLAANKAVVKRHFPSVELLGPSDWIDKAGIHFIRQKNGKYAANIGRSDTDSSRSSSSSSGGGDIHNQSSIDDFDVVVILSTLPRLHSYDARLTYIKPDAMSKQRMGVRAGKKGLIESGWRECMPKEGCKSAIDLLSKIAKPNPNR